MIEKRQFYINGAWTNPLDGQDHDAVSYTHLTLPTSRSV